MENFLRIQCGTCCRNLDKNNIYNDLDRGDGVCKYLDEVTNLCSIYETRPNKYNVEKGYQYHQTNEKNGGIIMELIIDRLTKNYQNKIAVDRMSIRLTEGAYGLVGAKFVTASSFTPFVFYLI
ncbi:MAG: YkgJ family cysteine cluster protein, partial [Cellulosilyticaceae bacterium]